MSIRFVPYRQIDKIKWDDCITHAANGLIYGYSFYLDEMAKQWDALVWNDYEAVMPLTWNSKYGIRYLYQPAFTPCLGVFGNTITPGLVNDFLDAVPSSFRFWEISLNQRNAPKVKGISIQQRVNYVLDLSSPYEELFKGFRENNRRNIKKSEQFGNTVQKGIPAGEIIQLAKEQMTGLTNLRDADWQHFEQLYHYLSEENKTETYGVTGKNGQLLASCIFFFSHGRAYYILVGNHPNGKTLGASHALLNAFIKDHAGQALLLDFEGSDISQLAFFYSGFGAVTESYPAIRLNRLPFYLKWAKK